jgi:YD repeat-containing protein
LVFNNAGGVVAKRELKIALMQLILFYGTREQTITIDYTYDAAGYLKAIETNDGTEY